MTCTKSVERQLWRGHRAGPSGSHTLAHCSSSCAIMPLGNRRHIPTTIKKLMVDLQTTKKMNKRQVAALLGVNPRTVRRVTKLEAETGSVVRVPVQRGPRRMLNGIDCAVRRGSIFHRSVYTLIGIESILRHYLKKTRISTCGSFRKTSSSTAVCTCP